MAWRRVVAGVIGALALSLVVAGPAAALPGGPTPLAGSSFQGGDGDQDDGAPYVDWQGFQAAGRVVHSPDPNEEDTAFAGGSKEGEPGSWDFATESGGVNPAKANILDGWSAVDQPGADTFVYLGFAREAADGDTYVAYELNQDARLWNNGRAKIPCRRTGDVLVVMAASGDAIDMILEEWTTTATDAATGCATKGHLARVTSVATSDAQGAVNSRPITSRLPGYYAPGVTIPDAGLFGEAALNLTVLLKKAFGDSCFAFGSVWMHSRSSLSEDSNLQDYVAPRALVVRTCAASGTKFLDLNANGQRDRGEPGVPRFLIWADYDNDGVRDAMEPYSVTDTQGHYVVEDIRPPNGTYRLRETLATTRPTRASGVVCSFPNRGTPGGFANGPDGLFGCGWGPISVATTPYARARDFGNWLPARLTVRKRLWPTDDPGRFDLNVNGRTVLPSAGDGATTTIAVRPGSYDVTESAVPPTDPSAYRSGVSCRAGPSSRAAQRPGTGYTGLVLRAGDQATCTFVNVRSGAPAIAIEKTGPILATTGDTLRYTLYVTNPGALPLPASTVTVSDPVCDQPPELVDEGGDATPRTLDPGDTWTYRCSNATAAPTADCVVSTVTNTATATGTARGTTVSDVSSITTTLICPHQPPVPPVPPPPPTPPPPEPPAPNPAPGLGPATAASIAPAGPRPPASGRIGVAGLRAPAGCIRRASQVRLVGTRIDRISVRVDGRQVSSRRALAILQRSMTVLRRVLPGHRHRVVIRVEFQRGSGAPPVTLTRTVTVCEAPRPAFTG
jgi:uncharacterized repeat protein (TIGR01451 family)